VKRMLVALCVLVSLGLIQPSASASTTRQLLPFFDVYRTCSGERITVRGHILAIETIRSGPNGVFHGSFTYVPLGITGRTASGVTYHQTGILHITFNVNASHTVGLTETARSILISAGPSPNSLVTETFHVTVRPDGVATSDLTNIRARCVG
jgi:hypothetical protein